MSVGLRLYILPLLVLAAYISGGRSDAGAGRAPCNFGGVQRRDGEQFDDGCAARCRCSDGNVGCVSMCPPFVTPAHCRRVRAAGDCCETARCPTTDAERAACVPASGDWIGGDDGSDGAPWAVDLTFRDAGGRERHCSASIMESTLLYMSPMCATANLSQYTLDVEPSRKVYGRPTGGSAGPDVRPVSLYLPDATPLTFDRRRHEINRPYAQVCVRDDCGLYVASVPPTTAGGVHHSRLVRARRARPADCSLTAADRAGALACLELPPDNYPRCPGLDGAAVAVRDPEGAFYLVGLLAADGDPAAAAGDQKPCDRNRGRFRKYLDVCREISYNH